MGNKFFTIQIDSAEPEQTLRFGQVVQVTHGTHAVFMTVHTSQITRYCMGCGLRSIKRGDWYVRYHGLRGEMNGGNHWHGNECQDCIARYMPSREYKFEVDDGTKRDASARETGDGELPEPEGWRSGQGGNVGRQPHP